MIKLIKLIIVCKKYVEILKKTKLKYIISMDLENDNDGIIIKVIKAISKGIWLLSLYFFTTLVLRAENGT